MREARSMGQKYHVMNVILTNHGVYIVEDSEESFKQSPQTLNHLAMTHKNVLSFNYKCMKGVSFAKRIDQRIVIKIDKQVSMEQDEKGDYPAAWWHDIDKRDKNDRKKEESKHTG